VTRKTSIGTSWTAPRPMAGARSVDQMRNKLGQFAEGTVPAKHLAAFQADTRATYHANTRPLIPDVATLLFTASREGGYAAWIYLHRAATRKVNSLHVVWRIGQGRDLPSLVGAVIVAGDTLRQILATQPQADWRRMTNLAVADAQAAQTREADTIGYDSDGGDI
jgi:hypothetical protein